VVLIDRGDLELRLFRLRWGVFYWTFFILGQVAPVVRFSRRAVPADAGMNSAGTLAARWIEVCRVPASAGANGGRLGRRSVKVVVLFVFSRRFAFGSRSLAAPQLNAACDAMVPSAQLQ
jgi:hypothetical protein